jgi:hypothetical protein
VAVFMRLVDALVRPFLLYLSGMLPSLFPSEWVHRPPLSLPEPNGMVCGPLFTVAHQATNIIVSILL